MQSSILDIQYLGLMGDGIHVGERERVFIERALPKERVRVSTERDKQGYLRGEILEIFEPSRFRQEPPCPHFHECGNCSLQHFTPDFYSKWKMNTVKRILFEKKLVPKKWLEPISVPQQDRRRVTFSAQKKNGTLKVGYYRRRSKQISEISSCLVTDAKIFALREPLKKMLEEIIVGEMPVDISLQLIGDQVDMVLTGPVGKNGWPERKQLDILKQFSESASITRISWRATDFGDIKKLIEKTPLVSTFGQLQVKLPSDAFLQPTVHGEKALVEGVLAALPESGLFADLFSGCGTFAGQMLAKGSVHAYEWSAGAVQALKASESEKFQAHRRDLLNNPLTRQELNEYDAVVFDPPRAGCPKQAEEMSRARTPLIIGVSCNPASFAKDAHAICRGGFQLESVQLIDQFLWSHHVELLAVFRRK